MSVSVDDSNGNTKQLVCRGCLKEWGVMKNMYQWGLDADFFKYTDIMGDSSDGLPELLCSSCEYDLQKIKQFKDTCQMSDKMLRLNAKKNNETSDINAGEVTSIFDDNAVILQITASNPEGHIKLPCPYNYCSSVFIKKHLLYTHMVQTHNACPKTEIELQYYCPENDCIYNKDAQAKYFTGRKYLNQHMNKKHKEKKFICKTCNSKFAIKTDYERHLKDCQYVYVCSACKKTYNNNETYLVHLLRKHPKLHAKYKQDRQAEKRSKMLGSEDISESTAKKPKLNKLLGNIVVRPLIGSPISIIPLKTGIETKNDTDINKEGVLEDAKIDDQVVINNEKRISVIQNNVTSSIDTEDQNTETMQTENMDKIKDNITKIIKHPWEMMDGEYTSNFDEFVNQEEILHEEEVVNDDALHEAGEEINQDIEILKKTSATQMPEEVTNDITLTMWSNKAVFEIQTDDISTQTGFEDLLPTQNGVNEIFFPESVSLTDIQTQTVPLEFGLSRCHKETQACSTSPVNIKQTQTCFCQSQNFPIFDAMTTSGNFISTETQTLDSMSPVHSDVMLSFSSAETQTCFEDPNDGSI